jgi:hypothetical protein
MKGLKFSQFVIAVAGDGAELHKFRPEARSVAIIVKTQIRHPILVYRQSKRTLVSIREMVLQSPAFRLKRI